MNDRLNNLLKQLDDQKNESIFNICVNQIIKLYALNPRFGSTIMKKIISLMMSKHTFQRQLAAALFEGLVDPIHDQIEEALKDESAYEQLTSVVVALSYTELLKEKSGELDKIIESSMKDMELDKMMMFVRDPQNCLYSKHEKAYAQSKKNTTQVVDEGMIMHQLGGTLDLKSIRDSDDPEEYIQSYIENARGKKSGKKGPIKKGAAVQNTKNGADDEEDEFMKDEIKDEITKKLKIQEDGTPVPDGRKQRRVSSILIIILDVARVLLFNQNWELRHGASMIIRAAARKAKSFYYFSHYDAIADFKDPAFSTNLKNTIQTEVSSGIHDLLMDVIIRNLLILALDRFSDFVGDKSSIIVRDISAQVIAESLSYLKDKEITQKMISYFKELLQRDIKQGWEPKHGVIYLMYRLIEKMPTLTKTFFNKFAETIHSKINEHEEILEVSCGFFQQALANEPDLFSSKILMLFCKSYLEAGEKLEDISYSVSPLSRLLGDFFKIMLSRPDMAVDGLGSQSIRIIMTKFFFQPVRVDLFYMLSNWLLLQSKTFSTSQGFTHISLLMKMYLIGIYTEEDKTRKEELVKNLKACQKTFNEAAQLHLVKIIAEICESCTIKEYLQVDEDSDMTEMIKSSKNWSDTSEEVLCSIKVFASIGEVLWTTIGQISPAKRPEAFKLLTNLKNTPQKEINSMQLVFYLVTVLKVSEGSAVVPPEIQGLAQLPTPEQALDYTPQQLWTKQISHMLCKSLDSLGQIVTDYLGGLEHEEIRETMFKVLMLLDAKKNLRWPEILTGLEASKDNLLELRKVLHQLAMSSKIPYTVYKLQVEFLDTRVIKSMKDALETLNQVGLYIKGTAASIITARDVAAKRKEKNLNKIIKPLLALFKIKDELDDTWGIIFAQGLFNICICFESDTSHPNNKIIQSVLSVCAEKDEQLAEFLQTTPESEQKQNKTSVEMSPIKPLLYFSLLIKRYAASSFSKYPTLSGIYESAKLIRLFLPIIFEHCPASLSLSFFEDHIKKIQDTKEFKSCYIILFILVNRSLQNHQLVDEDLARLLNSLLLHMHEAISQASMTGLETMLQLLREFEKEMIPFSKIFIKRTLKLINTDLAYEQKKLVYELFSRILTLSYVQDSDVQPKDLNELMLGKWMRGNSFLMEFRSNKLYMVDIPDIKSVQLRPYQLEGIAWVNFLFKYNLSGALCDDMGLGKTIQSLITVLIFEQKNPGSRSLIVCPNGLVKHWEMEAKKHYQGYNLKVSVIERGFTGNWKSYADTNLFITSDTMITKNSNLFEKEQFLVGVLDEAHLIKNEKSKLSKSIKTLSIRHKLALTGTPIQNNLLELWSIFDFLMPNYLGTREEFKKNFSRLFCLNLVNIDITKMDLTDDQTKDLQLLHQRVLPFILRRLKGQVLKDLPEKIIQDYECEMTDLQKKIYKVFEDSDLDQIEKALNIMEKAETAKPTTGPAAPEIAAPKKRIPLLQALNCMRKICNHPGLVDPKYCIGLTSEEQKELKQFDSSAKLRGLRTLFEQLGFDPEEDNYENGNKVLIFTRFIDTLGLLEGFFKHTFPKIKTCKIDGSMDTTIRYNVIDKFINEFDIKIMFLTTKVGGLGLNLSCANIVVMFDHDFNPTNDLQAMERAHRLGQKKVVNVYRFILKDTLEEKIMGIQKFKLSMANTVINMENSSINNIKDSKLVTLLDNLATHQTSKIEKEEDKLNPDKKKEFAGAYSKVIENSDLKEIWDENEYDREYR